MVFPKFWTLHHLFLVTWYSPFLIYAYINSRLNTYCNPSTRGNAHSLIHYLKKKYPRLHERLKRIYVFIYEFTVLETCSITRRKTPSACTWGADLSFFTFQHLWWSRTTFTKSTHRPRTNWNSTGCTVTEVEIVEVICIYCQPGKSFISSRPWSFCITWRSITKGII